MPDWFVSSLPRLLHWLNGFALWRGLTDIHRHQVAIVDVSRDDDADPVIVSELHFLEMKPIGADHRQVNLVVAEDERIVGSDESAGATRDRQLHLSVHAGHQ